MTRRTWLVAVPVGAAVLAACPLLGATAYAAAPAPPVTVVSPPEYPITNVGFSVFSPTQSPSGHWIVQFTLTLANTTDEDVTLPPLTSVINWSQPDGSTGVADGSGSLGTIGGLPSTPTPLTVPPHTTEALGTDQSFDMPADASDASIVTSLEFDAGDPSNPSSSKTGSLSVGFLQDGQELPTGAVGLAGLALVVGAAFVLRVRRQRRRAAKMPS